MGLGCWNEEWNYGIHSETTGFGCDLLLWLIRRISWENSLEGDNSIPGTRQHKSDDTPFFSLFFFFFFCLPLFFYTSSLGTTYP
jgi:hypothetical protein